jgi:adenylosuccinate synthase
VCTKYKYRGQLIDYVPYDVVNEPIEPVYEEVEGWNEALDHVTDIDELPQALHNYIAYIEKATGLPITIVSVGPDRKQTMLRDVMVK